MLVPYIDKARAERYGVLNRALGFNPNRRFPNLDKILPLPPADLPPWDGQRKSLLDAAMGVHPLPAIPQPSAASLSKEPYFLPADYALRPTGFHSDAPTAPFSAYWQPAAGQGLTEPARLLRKGEEFRHFSVLDANGKTRYGPVTWEQCLTIRHNHGAVEPRAMHGLLREVTRPEPWLSCACDQACPVSGVWQPWVAADHPLQAVVNQYWRQAVVREQCGRCREHKPVTQSGPSSSARRKKDRTRLGSRGQVGYADRNYFLGWDRVAYERYR